MNTVQSITETLFAVSRAGSLVNAVPVGEGVSRYIAEQINRTVLPRRLEVTLADGNAVIFDARNRRLLRYRASSDSAYEEEGILCRPEETADIVEELATLFDGTTVKRFRVIDDPSIVVPQTTGVAASTLLQRISAPERPTESEVWAAAFVESLEGSVIAACLLNGDEILAITGEDTQIFDMVDWTNAVLWPEDAPDGQMARDLNASGIWSVSWLGAEPGHLLVCASLDQIFVAVLEGIDNGSNFHRLRAAMETVPS